MSFHSQKKMIMYTWLCLQSKNKSANTEQKLGNYWNKLLILTIIACYTMNNSHCYQLSSAQLRVPNNYYPEQYSNYPYNYYPGQHSNYPYNYYPGQHSNYRHISYPPNNNFPNPFSNTPTVCLPIDYVASLHRSNKGTSVEINKTQPCQNKTAISTCSPFYVCEDTKKIYRCLSKTVFHSKTCSRRDKVTDCRLDIDHLCSRVIFEQIGGLCSPFGYSCRAQKLIECNGEVFNPQTGDCERPTNECRQFLFADVEKIV